MTRYEVKVSFQTMCKLSEKNSAQDSQLASQRVSGEKTQKTIVVTFTSTGDLFMSPMIIFQSGKVDKVW